MFRCIHAYAFAVVLPLPFAAGCDDVPKDVKSIAAPEPASDSIASGQASPTPIEAEKAPAVDLPAGESLLASAPRGVSLKDLGRPYDANFNRLQGTGGSSLFPGAKEPHETPQNYMEHKVTVVRSSDVLAANASAWSVNLSGGLANDRRYASYRALQIQKVVAIDDTTAMRDAPSNALYYPSKIYFGHSYEALFEGDKSKFSLELEAKLFNKGGGIKAFVENNGLKMTVFGHGLKPKNPGAIFATNQSEIEAKYEASNDEPVPILVEWRTIPGRVSEKTTIEWENKGPVKIEPKDPGATPQGGSGSSLCSRWEFDKLEFQVPNRKPNGKAWDADGSGPDVVLSLRAAGLRTPRVSRKKQGLSYSWSFPPVTVDRTATVVVRAIDKDMMSDDPITNVSVAVKETKKSGVLKIDGGLGFLKGRCVESEG